MASEPKRGTCRECDRKFLLTRKGVIRHHGSDEWYMGRRKYRCAGVGKPPKESTDGR